MRWQIPLIGIVVASLVIAGVLFVVLNEAADRAERGTGSPRAEAPEGTRSVSVKQTSAEDFDPQGDGREHTDELPRAVDTDPNTVWKTENYSDAVFPTGKTGVGIYVDAAPDVDATQIAIRSPDPGFDVELYAANGDDPPKEVAGWTKVGGGTLKRERQRFKLTGDRRYRYYLVWITSLPEDGQAEIAEITLYAPATS